MGSRLTRTAKYTREYHRANRIRLNEARKRRVERNHEYTNLYKLKHPCVDCGETDPEVLQFDHVRGKKIVAVSILVGKAVSIKKIQEEIDKCEVRCSNCHLKVTALRGRHISYRNKYRNGPNGTTIKITEE